MALGAIVVQKQGVIGNMKFAVVDVVGDSSYPTTGSPLDLFAVCGMTNVYMVDCDVFKPTPAINAPLFSYDYTNKKLQGFGTAGNALGLTEVTSTTNLSTLTIRLLIFGS